MSSPFAHFFREGLFNSYLRSYAHAHPHPRPRTHARTREKTNVCLKHPLETSACHDDGTGTGTMAPHHTTPHQHDDTGTMAPSHGHRHQHRHRHETTPDTTPNLRGDHYHARLHRMTGTTAPHHHITIIPTPRHAQVNAQRLPALSRPRARRKKLSQMTKKRLELFPTF